MKQIIGILLLSAVLFQSASKLLYIVNYSVNKSYIAKNLCENRNKPKMKCNGKCHLKKQLAQAEKNESQGKSDSKEKWEDLFFASFQEFFYNEKAQIKNSFTYKNSLLVSYSPSIYHPPKV